MYVARGLLVELPGAMTVAVVAGVAMLRTDDVIMPSMHRFIHVTVTCRSFFETDGYVFETGSVTELCDWFASHISKCTCDMWHALTFIHGLKGAQCFDILARPDVV